MKDTVVTHNILSCALGSYAASGLAGGKSPLGLPSWAPSWTCAAKLGCPAALGRHFGLPGRTCTQFWPPTWRPSASPERPGAPRTLNFARRYGTLATFSKIGFCAPQVLLECLLAALGAFLGAFWAQLGASWASLGLNLALQTGLQAQLGPSTVIAQLRIHSEIAYD